MSSDCKVVWMLDCCCWVSNVMQVMSPKHQCGSSEAAAGIEDGCEAECGWLPLGSPAFAYYYIQHKMSI